MRIIDFIEPDYRSRSKIWAKHVDFLICNQKFEPVLAIELNGKSHLAQNRIDRDTFVRNALGAASLQMELVEVGDDFSKRVKQIKLRLSL